MPSGEVIESSGKNSGKKQQQQHVSLSSSSSSSCDSLFSEEDILYRMPSPPDGGFGWMIVFSAFMVNLISDGISFSFGIMYTELLDYFGESKSLTSWIGSIFYGTCLMGGPLASALATKFGCRKVLMVGGLVATGGTFISAYMDDVRALCFTFGLITGLGLSMGYVVSVVMVAFYFEDKRALATGLSVCGSGIGTFVLAPFTEMLIKEYGWKGTMIIWSGIMLNLVVCGALMRPLEFTPQERRQRALQRFERMSRTVSYTSFSYTGKSQSRLASNGDSLDSEDEKSEEDNMEHCHSQIQIPTYIKDKKIPIPIEILKEAHSNKYKLKEHMKKYCDNMDKDPSKTVGPFKLETSDSRANTKITFEKGKETVKLLNGNNTDVQPCNSCLKKSATHYDTRDIREVKQKQVRMSSYLPLYRKDIFFRGNLTKLTHPTGQVRSTSCPELYKGRIDDSDSDSSDDEWESVFWRYLKFSKHMKRVLKTLFDPSILLHPLYVLFATSNFILYFWYDVPYIFMADRAEEFGMSESKASFLISILGIVNTIGQIFYGFLGDREINLSLLYGISLMLCGVSVFLTPVFVTFLPLGILSGAFGFFISVNYALSTVILVEYLGLDKLSNAYGLTMLVQGIANLVGPPIAAFLYDQTGSYDATFYMGGAFIVFSGMMLLIVPILRHCRSKLDLEFRTRSATMFNASDKINYVEPPTIANGHDTTYSTLLVKNGNQETVL